MGKQRRLSITPTPLAEWGENLRSKSALGKSGWTKLRLSLLPPNMKCETCGTHTTRLSGHEVWHYETSVSPAVAVLKKIEFVCTLCHACEHFLRTKKFGNPQQIEAAIEHYCRINRVSRAVFHRDCGIATARWIQLSALEWGPVDYGPYAALVNERRTRPKKPKTKLMLSPADSEPPVPGAVVKRGPRPMFGRPLTGAEHAARRRYFKKQRGA
jgi:hypothetical protein